ncbi:hypothetical protein CBS101457_005875 [Exobasidium rhododendri]|nr:hypothetical protein CBS101457_005875 [Exobasidium rhododendri]
MKEEVDQSDAEAWIVDVHTHILPPRLASKIRAFFEVQISQAGVDTKSSIAADPSRVEVVVEDRRRDVQDSSRNASSSSCCGTGFVDREEWTQADFAEHGSFRFPYHPYDVQQLAKEQRKNAIHTIWILPYAHKSGISSALNSAIVDICSNISGQQHQRSHGVIDGKTGSLNRAIAAFTVHPADGKDGVRATTLQALREGCAMAAKLHCSVGDYSVLHPNLTPFWQLSNQCRFPVVVHFGKSISGNTATTELGEIEELLLLYPHVPLIIAHSGHPAILRAIKLAMKFDNVYLDTTPVVTKFPAYPPPSHSLHSPLMALARNGRIMFGSDLPNVAVPLSDQIQAVFHTFGDPQWSPPSNPHSSDNALSWWTSKEEAHRAGRAVEQVLFGAATSLLARVDISKAGVLEESSKM